MLQTDTFNNVLLLLVLLQLRPLHSSRCVMSALRSVWESSCHLNKMRQLSWARWQGSEPCAFTGVVNLLMALTRSKQRISALFPVTDFNLWIVNPTFILPQCISQQAPACSSCSAAEIDQKLAFLHD